MEADRKMSDPVVDDLVRPLTWRHRFVQWLAHVLGVRLYSCPVILLVARAESPDERKIH